MNIAAFPKYESYRSDVAPWLGKVPDNWRFEKAKWLLKCKKQLNTDGRIDNVLSLTLRGVVNNDPDNPEGLIPKDYRTYQIFNADDLVFKLIDLENIRTSRVGLVHEQGIMSSAYIRIEQATGWNPRFLYYYYYHLYESEVFNKIGSGVRSTLGKDDLLELPIPVIGRAYQDKIVRFLDEKCAKIDEAVRIREAQIALLQERRQILIQQAVTRGLNPDAPMKDSGIDWIGQIPAHWEVKKIAHVATVDAGSTPNRSVERYWNGDIPWVKTSEVHYAIIFTTEEHITQEGLKTSSLRLAPPGTLLMAMYGQGVTRGRVAILGVAATYNQACCAIKLDDTIDVDFAQNFFIAAYPYIRDHGNETSQMNLSAGYISSLKILAPPINEQTAITEALLTYHRKSEKSIATKQSQITALKEYKTVLINAAVTGKIKVTGEEHHGE